jgi:transposase-like protein
MTDMGRMSVQELLGKMLADEHADVLRQAVCWLAQELMEAKFSLAAGAGYGERHPDRTARRNGYRASRLMVIAGRSFAEGSCGDC